HVAAFIREIHHVWSPVASFALALCAVVFPRNIPANRVGHFGQEKRCHRLSISRRSRFRRQESSTRGKLSRRPRRLDGVFHLFLFCRVRPFENCAHRA